MPACKLLKCKHISKFALIILCHLSVSSHSEIVLKNVDAPKKVAIIKIVGEIIYEEDIAFEKLLDKLKADGYAIKNDAIAFNTQGGNAHAARSIGKIIRQRRLNTYLAPKDECGSACIFALIGGVVRNVYGTVSVHRSSHSDVVPLEKIKKFTDWGDAAIYQHVYEMGISHNLTDAILTTPHWANRLLSETELRRWAVNGTDRMYEEFNARVLAMETHTSVEDVQTRILSMKNHCEEDIRDFKMTQWNCIRLQYYWAMKNIRYDSLPRMLKNYSTQNFNYIESQNLLQFR